MRPKAVIAEIYIVLGIKIFWDLCFRRICWIMKLLLGFSYYQRLKRLFSLLKEDERLWGPDPKGQFSVKSFYDMFTWQSYTHMKEEGWTDCWNRLVPPRILVLCFLARLQKKITMHKLKKIRHVIVNGCPLCLEDKESANHLLLHCCFATKVWAAVCNRFRMLWVMLRTIFELFWHWKFTGGLVC